MAANPLPALLEQIDELLASPSPEEEPAMLARLAGIAQGGEIQPGLTWADDTSRYAIQRNGGVLSRIRYLSIDANSFLWRSDISRDGGKTWLLDAGMMEARRIGK